MLLISGRKSLQINVYRWLPGDEYLNQMCFINEVYVFPQCSEFISLNGYETFHVAVWVVIASGQNAFTIQNQVHAM